MGDDGAALRGLQGRRGAPVLPRSFRAARSPDRAGRCARGVQRRTGSAARPRSGAGGHSRLLPDRPQHAVLSSLFRPRIDRILFAATKADHLHHSSHDRLEAVLRRTVAKAAARAEVYRRRDRCRGAGRGARHPRGAGAARPRQAAVDPRHACCGRDRRMARRSTAIPKSRPFRATCPPIPKSCSRATTHFAASPARRPKTPIFAFCAFGRRSSRRDGADEPALPHIRLDRALQFLIGDRLQ